MDRAPRPPDERILTRERWVAVAITAATMATGTLAVLELAPGPTAAAGVPTVAGTMGFTTFVLYQAFNIMNVRSERGSAASPITFTNWRLWVSVAIVLVLQVSITTIGPLRDLFDLTSLEPAQWLVCVAVASSVLVVDEVRKAVLRLRDQRSRTVSRVGTR